MAKKQQQKKPPTQQDIDKCLASAIAEGDIVNFRFLFLPFSPLRAETTEDLHTEKYRYLLPPDESHPRFREALQFVAQDNLRAFVRAQLDKNGPPQLPSEMLVLLADNAVRLEKFTAAAQAYELLRIRRRMQEEFYRQADAALDQQDIRRAVQGYVAATGLEFDYGAFPEPMPAVPHYQTRALMLHAEYPLRPEDSVPLQAPEVQVNTALNYLLLHADAAGRLETRPLEVRLEFLAALVQKLDPRWPQFQARYREACELVKEQGERLQQAANQAEGAGNALEREIADQQTRQDPRQISARLLGREIPEGDWWQYLKELAYEHPAAILFVSRQVVSKDVEIIMPRYRKDSPLVRVFGLEADE